MKGCSYNFQGEQKSKMCFDKGPEGYKAIFTGKNGEVLANKKVDIYRSLDYPEAK